MKELEFTIEGKGSTKGYVYTRMVVTPSCYIYKAVSPIRTVKYEVFKRKVVREFTLDNSGRKKEVYPRDEDFGRIAFTYNNMNDAYVKMQDIINRYEDYE